MPSPTTQLSRCPAHIRRLLQWCSCSVLSNHVLSTFQREAATSASATNTLQQDTNGSICDLGWHPRSRVPLSWPISPTGSLAGCTSRSAKSTPPSTDLASMASLRFFLQHRRAKSRFWATEVLLRADLCFHHDDPQQHTTTQHVRGRFKGALPFSGHSSRMSGHPSILSRTSWRLLQTGEHSAAQAAKTGYRIYDTESSPHRTSHTQGILHLAARTSLRSSRRRNHMSR